MFLAKKAFLIYPILFLTVLLLASFPCQAQDPAPLSAQYDLADVPENSSFNINILDNDTGEAIQLHDIALPDSGTLVIEANQSITYTPNPNFQGIEVIEYQIIDAHGETAVASVFLTVLDMDMLEPHGLHSIAYAYSCSPLDDENCSYLGVITADFWALETVNYGPHDYEHLYYHIFFKELTDGDDLSGRIYNMSDNANPINTSFVAIDSIFHPTCNCLPPTTACTKDCSFSTLHLTPQFEFYPNSYDSLILNVKVEGNKGEYTILQGENFVPFQDTIPIHTDYRIGAVEMDSCSTQVAWQASHADVPFDYSTEAVCTDDSYQITLRLWGADTTYLATFYPHNAPSYQEVVYANEPIIITMPMCEPWRLEVKSEHLPDTGFSSNTQILTGNPPSCFSEPCYCNLNAIDLDYHFSSISPDSAILYTTVDGLATNYDFSGSTHFSGDTLANNTPFTIMVSEASGCTASIQDTIKCSPIYPLIQDTITIKPFTDTTFHLLHSAFIGRFSLINMPNIYPGGIQWLANGTVQYQGYSDCPYPRYFHIIPYTIKHNNTKEQITAQLVFDVYLPPVKIVSEYVLTTYNQPLTINVLVNDTLNYMPTTIDMSTTTPQAFFLDSSNLNIQPWHPIYQPVRYAVQNKCYIQIGYSTVQILDKNSDCLPIPVIDCSTIEQTGSYMVSLDIKECLGSYPYHIKGDHTETIYNDTSIQMSFPATYGYSFVLTNQEGDLYLFDKSVDLPCQTTPLWAGDINQDGVVDMLDFLTLGLAYGEKGQTQTKPTIEWEEQTAFYWETVFTDSTHLGLNHVYADCNGDGFINAGDTLAILNNYQQLLGKHQTASSVSQNNDFPLYWEVTDTLISGYDHQFAINLGNTDEVIEDIYGISFSIEFELADSIPDSLQLQIQDPHLSFADSWLGTKNVDLLTLDTCFKQERKWDIALTRTNKVPKSGHGNLCTVSCIMEIGPLKNNNFTAIPVQMRFSNVQIWSNTGKSTFVNSSDEQEITILPEITTAISTPPVSPHSFQLFPNPTQQWVQLQLPLTTTIAPLNIRIFDTVGNEVLQQTIHHQTHLILDVSQLPTGVYFAQLYDGKQSQIKKLVIQ